MIPAITSTTVIIVSRRSARLVRIDISGRKFVHAPEVSSQPPLGLRRSAWHPRNLNSHSLWVNEPLPDPLNHAVTAAYASFWHSLAAGC